MQTPKCRFCETNLKHTFADLGVSPLANSYLNEAQLHSMEPFYPLHAYVCDACFLVQLKEYESPQQIFGEYAYFSSYSDTWLDHAKNYTEQAIDALQLNADSLVVEAGSNDGYLLQFFLEKGIPVLGVEPAENVAKVAQKKGIPTVVDFFGSRVASELVADGKAADLINATNVLSQVPDLHDFADGIRTLLKPSGVATIEFPHLLRLMEECQFDTIYHEHFSYFSSYTVSRIFAEHGLSLFDVEELPTFGGSLRIYLHRSEDASRAVSSRVSDLLAREGSEGVSRVDTYLRFNEKVMRKKREILTFLLKAKDENKTVAGYGAPAKANTLMNYCGIRTDLIDFTVDRSPHKQGLFLPGTHIPIYSPDEIERRKPDLLVIFPWNIKEEIMEQMSAIRTWGGKFVVFIPDTRVYA